MFVPVTFICDTGAPSSIYVNEITRRLLGNRILTSDMDTQYIVIDGKKYSVNTSPSHHPDSNIIGLVALLKL